MGTESDKYITVKPFPARSSLPAPPAATLQSLIARSAFPPQCCHLLPALLLSLPALTLSPQFLQSLWLLAPAWLLPSHLCTLVWGCLADVDKQKLLGASPMEEGASPRGV